MYTVEQTMGMDPVRQGLKLGNFKHDFCTNLNETRAGDDSKRCVQSQRKRGDIERMSIH